MKRFLTLIVAAVMTLAAMAQSSGIVLSYNKGEELKYFRSDQLTEAINAAEVNDTIYFGPGEYSIEQLPGYEPGLISYNKQINKPLTFIGAGMHSNGTLFTGNKDLILNIDPSLEESQKVFSFEGISFTGSRDASDSHAVIPTSNLKELKFINVEVSYKDSYRDDSGRVYEYKIDNLVFDGCISNNIYINHFLNKRIDIRNTKIKSWIFGGADSSFGVATLNHCFINRIGSDFIGLVEHSLIRETSASAQTSLVDCCYYNETGSASKEDCKKLEINDVATLDNSPSSLGVCKDGTPYGTKGGGRPLSNYAPYPTPDLSVDPNTGKSKSYLEYDAINKKLTITVKRIGE